MAASGQEEPSAPGAAELGRRIQAFWASVGYDIQVEIIHAGGPRESPVYGIRSNLIAGLPRPAMTKPGGSVCQINRTRLWPFVAVQRHAVALETLSLDEPISVTLDLLSVTLPNEGAQRRDELCQLRQKKLPPISPG
jgi:hypothetical protein